MRKTADSVMKRLNRARPKGGGLIAGFMVAVLLAGANLAAQAADFNPIADSYTDEAEGSENNGRVPACGRAAAHPARGRSHFLNLMSAA